MERRYRVVRDASASGWNIEEAEGAELTLAQAFKEATELSRLAYHVSAVRASKFLQEKKGEA